DTRTGKPADWSALPDDQQRAIADLERGTAYLFELGMLARRIPPLPSVEIPPFAPIPDDQGSKFLDFEAKNRAIIDSASRSPRRIRAILETLSYQDSGKYLIGAVQQLGLPGDAIVLDGDLSALRELINELIKAMPIQGIFTELRIQTHLKKDWK